MPVFSCVTLRWLLVELTRRIFLSNSACRVLKMSKAIFWRFQSFNKFLFMLPVDSYDSLLSVLYASVFIVPRKSFELKPKLVAQYTIRHQKFVVVTDCPSSWSFLKLHISFCFELYYPQDGMFLSVVSLLLHGSHLEMNTPFAIAMCNLSNLSPTLYALRRAAEIIQCDKNR
jgi:hypothetical protein